MVAPDRAISNYDAFAKFYDAVMGDRSASTKRLLQYIRRANPKAQTLLELGCGTGSVLKHLAKNYEVSGVDLSSSMLAIAARKVPGAKLFRQDMANFNLGQTFDVVCCVFDSINHLLRFADWKKLFANVERHLTERGCFIFDINTQRKLDRHMAEPPWVHIFGRNVLLMDVTAAPNHCSNWNIKVFEWQRGNRYLLHEENIGERSFPSPQIIRALKPLFRNIEIIDTERKQPSRESERLYFVCVK